MPDRDLALLAVDQPSADAWAAAVGRGQGPALAEPGTEGLPAEAVGYPNATLEDDFPHPELVLGWLKPAGGVVSGRMPFDVDGSVPDDSLLWQGMSGAAVRDRRTAGCSGWWSRLTRTGSSGGSTSRHCPTRRPMPDSRPR